MTPPHQATLYCHRSDGASPWTDFASHPQVTRLYDAKRQVYAVTVAEGPLTDGCYWGWWDNERSTFQFVFPERGLVEMCWPYGTRVEEARGKGELLPVQILDPRPVTDQR